jgi:Cu2+-exporting ATPase
MSGRGVEATVEGATIAVGGPAFLRERGYDLPAALQEVVERWQGRGAAVLYGIRDGEIFGGLSLEDKVRPESREGGGSTP